MRSPWAAAPHERLDRVRLVVFVFGCGYLLIRTPYLLGLADLPTTRFRPVSVTEWWLDGPMSRLQTLAAVLTVVALGVAALRGLAYRIVAPLFAAGLWMLLSYRNSFGQVLHTENLLVLHCAVLALGPGPRRSRRVSDAPAPDQQRAGLVGHTLWLMTAVTAATYVIAAWAKLRAGAWDWVSGDVLRNHIAHDNLRKLLLGDAHSALGGWLTRFGALFPPMAMASMALELAAPLALMRWQVRRWWLVAMYCFHLGVLALMAILFPYQLTGVAFASALPLERLRAPSTWRATEWAKRGSRIPA